jgi:ketosteroid isomerase-like protein
VSGDILSALPLRVCRNDSRRAMNDTPHREGGTVAEDAEHVAATYFSSWQAKDFETFRSLLADDVVFDGPLGHVEGADACTESLQRLAQIVTDIVIQHRFADGPDVLTWYDLHTSVAPPCPTANWSHVEDGKITRIRVTFDPRPLSPP